MHRFVLALIGGIAALPMMAIDGHAQNPAGVIQGPRLVNSDVQPLYGKAKDGRLESRSLGIPPKKPFDMKDVMRQSEAQEILPLWNGTLKTGGKSFNFTMVGKNPVSKQANPKSNIPTVIIPVKFTFTPQNVVFDPTVKDPTCSPKFTPLNLTTASPIFATQRMVVGGHDIGTGQYVDLYQRAQFWDFTKPGAINSGYHVSLLYPKKAPTLSVLAQNFTVVDTPCGKLGKIKLSQLQDFIEAQIPLLKQYITPTTFPIFLFYNIGMYEKTPTVCCVNGFHSAMQNSAFGNAVQTYAVASYDTSDAFLPSTDIAILTHEVGEWMDDPAVSNPTPAWGHIGQEKNCSKLLENGDPLTGTVKTYTNEAGLTYHVQDLAFVPWFYRTAAKNNFSRNGWYSFLGTFKSFSKPCP